MGYRLKHARELASVPKGRIGRLTNECPDGCGPCEGAGDFFDCRIAGNVCGTDCGHPACGPLKDYGSGSGCSLLAATGNGQKKAAYTFTDTPDCLPYPAKEPGYGELCGNTENMTGTLFEREKGTGRSGAEEKLNINRHGPLNKGLSVLTTRLTDEYERTGRDAVDGIGASTERDKIIESSIIRLSVNAKANLCLQEE